MPPHNSLGVFTEIRPTEFVSRYWTFFWWNDPEDQASQWSENEPSKVALNQTGGKNEAKKKKKVWQKVLQIALEISERTLNSKHQGQHLNADCGILFSLRILAPSPTAPSLFFLFICLPEDRSANHINNEEMAVWKQ